MAIHFNWFDSCFPHDFFELICKSFFEIIVFNKHTKWENLSRNLSICLRSNRFLVFWFITIGLAPLALRIIVMILYKRLSIYPTHSVFLFLSKIFIIFHFIFYTRSALGISIIGSYFKTRRRIAKAVLILLNACFIMWRHSMLRSFLVMFRGTWKFVSDNGPSSRESSDIASASSIIILISPFVNVDSKGSITIGWLRMWSAHVIRYNHLAFSVMRRRVWMVTWSTTDLDVWSFVKSSGLCMEPSISCSHIRSKSFLSEISINLTSSSEWWSLILSYWLSSWWRIINSRIWKSLMVIPIIFGPIIAIVSLLWSWHYKYKFSTFSIQ